MEEITRVESLPVDTTSGAASYKELAKQALNQFNRMEQYSRNGDWAEYGEELQNLKETLKSLQAAVKQ